MTKILVSKDPLQHLKTFTDARIAIGRVGGSLPTKELLSFRLDQARARDAVHADFDTEALAAELRSLDLGLDILHVESNATDHASFLKNPGLGRALKQADKNRLLDFTQAHVAIDVVLLISDGLSALAVQKNACELLRSLIPILQQKSLTIGPVVIARHARVALQDDVGEALKAKLAVILIGERPGLGSTDSMSAYLVYQPRAGNSDADRNCISNIRASGFAPSSAAAKLAELLQRCLAAKLSGVLVKDDDMNGKVLTPRET